MMRIFRTALRWFKNDDTDWYWVERLGGRPPLMRRRVGGRSEERQMTDKEMFDYLKNRAGW
jgi:hypothetical protein